MESRLGTIPTLSELSEARIQTTHWGICLIRGCSRWRPPAIRLFGRGRRRTCSPRSRPPSGQPSPVLRLDPNTSGTSSPASANNPDGGSDCMTVPSGSELAKTKSVESGASPHWGKPRRHQRPNTCPSYASYASFSKFNAREILFVSSFEKTHRKSAEKKCRKPE